MISHLRVGFPVLGSSDWMGGFTYIELLVKALASLPREERPQLFLVINDYTLKGYSHFARFVSYFDDLVYIGDDLVNAEATLKRKPVHFESLLMAEKFLDCFYPVLYDLWSYNNGIASIFDFQHYYLQNFFSKIDLFFRKADSERIAENAKIIIFNSLTSEQDFKRLFPKSKALTYALPFHVYHGDECYTQNPIDIQQKYNLPDRFLICCNQFWIHKDHGTLFEAIAHCRECGESLHVVCTGMTDDYRFPGYFSELQNKIERLQISDLVHILGFIPRNDQLQLMRRSIAVVQPSLFEGWSTVIEDARALGKTIIMSDLSVNIEQSPCFGYYYERNNFKALSKVILDIHDDLEPGPDLGQEDKARMDGKALIRAYGDKFCSIINDAYRIFSAGKIEFDEDFNEILRELRCYEARIIELKKQTSFSGSLKTVVGVIAQKLHMYELLCRIKPLAANFIKKYLIRSRSQKTIEQNFIDSSLVDAIAVARTISGGLDERQLLDIFTFGTRLSQVVCIDPNEQMLQASYVLSHAGSKVVCIVHKQKLPVIALGNMSFYRGSMHEWLHEQGTEMLGDVTCIMCRAANTPLVLQTFEKHLFPDTYLVVAYCGETIPECHPELKKADIYLEGFNIYQFFDTPAIGAEIDPH